MQQQLSRGRASTRLLITLLAFAALTLATAGTAAAQAPWDGSPISQGLGPTYGEPWCASPAGEPGIAGLQGPPLALIPYGAIGCSLEKFQQEATAAGVPQRMTYSSIGKTVLGRDLWAVVVNALETPEQQRDYQRWQQLRAIEKENPAAAQALLATWGTDVKMPIFVEANIHGGEREGADAMMQAIRDLVTTPRGTNALIDKLLDNTVLIVIPSQNPDGRVVGTRQNENRFDMNRDLLVQSQPEIKANVKLQQQWLATNGLALHGYVNPTLIDALTKPHNPGLEYDIFLKWNQRRIDDNEARVNAIPGNPGSTGFRITRPVNDWCPEGDEPNTPGGPCDDGVTMPGPATAEGWDDWGPFYTQTYISLLGIDGSTVEMCSSSSPTAGCGGQGRLGSKKVQYVTFYSSMDYWISNKQAMMNDKLEIYRRGVTDAPRPNCCDDPEIASRGFDEANHNWMVEYPRAYIIPWEGGGQRSDAEANRLVQWLLDNGIKVHRSTAAFTWNGVTYPAGSYVVFMNQAFRGLALTALSAGQDISDRITQLYAPPGAWSHGLLWGADTVEVPRGAAFAPATTEVTAPTSLAGGVRGGAGAPAEWYSVTIRGAIELRAILNLLKSGIYGELAEAPFTSTTGGPMPAGTLIFPNDAATVAALQAAGQSAGIWFERNVGVAKPATSQVEKAPRIAVLVNSASPETSTVSRPIHEVLETIFGSDSVGFVSTVTGSGSLQNAATDPLRNFDVIYNTGIAYPATTSQTARDRLAAFFARGGGYIGTSQSGTNFTFLTGGALVNGTFTHASQGGFGGIALWENTGGTNSPLTGGYPVRDTLFLPSSVTYFDALPTGAVVDGRYRDTTENMWVAGLWRNRSAAVPGSPVIVHGTTTAGSRYAGISTDPISRHDAEREWPLLGQMALWSTLTDEADSEIGFPADGSKVPRVRYEGRCNGDTGFCGSASGAPGPAIERVEVAVQRLATGLWWDGAGFSSATPVYAPASGTESWFYAFATGNFPASGRYVVRSRATSVGGNEEATPDTSMFTLLQNCSVVARGRLVAGRAGVLNLRANARGPRGAERAEQPLRFSLRGVGVARTVTADPSARATLRVRPKRAGSIRVTAAGPSLASCSARVRVRPAPRSRPAGAGTGGPALTGRP
ncbi:MAG TPA: M14 family zinc carboxypeptidase [Gaiellaceae bacterium]|nr:M14 family zinc carboxypeptidase [Gaiellaceae bacterium]